MAKRACILRMEGTNCEEETRRALEEVGLEAELVHLKQLTGDVPKQLKRNLLDYQVLALPGGWSAGDHVRAGAIFAARIKSELMADLKVFSKNGAVIGICNGFQILLELGMLPGWQEEEIFGEGSILKKLGFSPGLIEEGVSKEPLAALIPNLSGKFQCRPSLLRHENKCKLTEEIPEEEILQFPVAHAEGRLTFGGGKKDEKFLEKLREHKQIVFRYCRADGNPARGEFPWNPNGSLHDIAGISNPEGNILGIMPHPERVVHKFQEADWTRKNGEEEGPGKIFFESLVNYVKEL